MSQKEDKVSAGRGWDQQPGWNQQKQTTVTTGQQGGGTYTTTTTTTYGQGQTVYGQGQPVYGQGTAVYGQGQPVYGQGTAVYGQGTTGQSSWGTSGTTGQNTQSWGTSGTTGQQGTSYGTGQQTSWGTSGTTGQQGTSYGTGQQTSWGTSGTTGQNTQSWGTSGTTGQQGTQGWGTGTNLQQGNQGWGTSGTTGQQTWGQGSNTTQTQNFGPSLFDSKREYMIFTALDDDDMCLDVSQKNDQSKFKMVIWNKHGQSNQRFRFQQVGNGKYLILSSNGTVEVPNNSKANGEQILASQRNNTENETWQIYPSQNVKSGYIIKSSFSGKVLDVCEQKKSKNTPVIQWDYNGGKNQAWIIRPC